MAEDPQNTELEDTDQPKQMTEEQLRNMSYEEYLQLVNPDKSLPEIQKMIRKERRYIWLGRFEILALIVFVCLIVFFIVTK